MQISNVLIAAAMLGACAQPAAAPRADATVDIAAVRAGLDALREQYRQAELAADPAAVAALYDANGAIDFFRAPPMRGKAGIQAGMTAAYAALKNDVVEITAGQTNARSNSEAIELGTYHNSGMLGGKRTHEWGRWLSSAMKDSTGTWKLQYLMGFADSNKTDK